VPPDVAQCYRQTCAGETREHTGPVSSLADAVAGRVVVLDGGLATELEAQGHDLSSVLWSARLLADDPDAIRAAHAAYFAAGAEVATTASYQASFDGLAAVGSDPAALMRRSVELAARARDEHGSGWVAASVGPFGAVLADGSEYRGDYGRSVTELRRFHRPRLDVLSEAGADVLAVETIPCLAEVEAIVIELDRVGMPAWLSVTCAGDRTRAGEPLAEAFAMARECAAVFAAGVNCTAPRDVGDAVRLAAATAGKPVVAYPNSGEGWDAAGRTWSGTAGVDVTLVPDWIAGGARLVGGCCRVGPDQIELIAAALAEPDPGSR
jgi:homocysteine S-methyltransferase